MLFRYVSSFPRLFHRQYGCFPRRLDSLHRLCLWNDPFWKTPHYGPLIVTTSYSTRRIKTKKHIHIHTNNQFFSKMVKDSVTSSVWQPHMSIAGRELSPMLCSKYNIHWKSNLNAQKEAKIPLPKEKTVLSKIDNVVTDKETDRGKSSGPSSDMSSTDTNLVPSSIQSPEEPAEKIIKKNIGRENLLSRVQRYLFLRYSWYLKKFQESLENEMPDTFNMFRIFTVGLKDFIIDFNTLRTLSRRELELYHQMPGDMIRVFPILLLSSIPFGQNVAFPIGYWFPRYLLCHHFWDIQQRHDFAVLALKKRLFNARPVFRSLQAALYTISDEQQQEKCKTVFYKLGSGIHPTTKEIISLLPLFRGDPFHINRMWSTHVNGLLRLHGRSVLGRRRHRLEDQARILHSMDAAISREGIDSMNHDQLKSCLFLRGLNPTSMSTAAMIEFLESWLSVSREIDASTYSLLLHLPILLAYNQPTNIVLIY
ncbi:LETM1 domain-containing protein 1-like [Homarus americanus]|uniref:LETM1 domain-containing protein 1-like n=1 Tax=Homarus americanus TaxID=6706 RepID=A0A8J5JUF3_HOMAM|nr:LETM1 domain-containing protein 1-like [Homarus americanus]